MTDSTSSAATDAEALLAQADACHDAQPATAGAWLRTLPLQQLSAASWPRTAVLINHVLGELLGEWPEADRRQRELVAAAGAQATPVLLRHAAVSARLAQSPDAPAATAALAQACGVSLPQADELVAVAAASFQLSPGPAVEAASRALSALRALKQPPWQSSGPLDTAAAVACNNIASHFIERPIAELDLPAVRAVIADAALLSQTFWLRAGTWVNHERAWYLRAMASHALHEPEQAMLHAQQGLALIDAHDAANEQRVDRAFLTLELALAYQRIGRAQQAAEARAKALVLAEAFDEPGLREWFDERLTRHEALAHAAR